MLRRTVVSRYLKQRRIRKVKNLLKGGNDTVAEDEVCRPLISHSRAPDSRFRMQPEEPEVKDVPVVSYWHPNVTIGLVTDPNPQSLTKLPPVLTQRASFLQSRDPPSPQARR